MRKLSKPLNILVRKFAWLPVRRLDGVIKSADKSQQHANYSVFWLEHYWKRETINPSRQLVVNYFSDQELFDQEYLPAITGLLAQRTEGGQIELDARTRGAYLNQMIADVNPEDAVHRLTGKTFYQFWIDTAAQLFHVMNLLESPYANNHKLAKDLFDYYQDTDHTRCHPIEFAELLQTLKQDGKLIISNTGTKIHITLNVKNRPLVLEY